MDNVIEPKVEDERAEVEGCRSFVVRRQWLLSIGKAASALRFVADNWEWNTEPAKSELREIAQVLSDIESSCLR